MKFNMYFGKVKSAVMIFVGIISLILICFDICLLVGVNGLMTMSIGATVASMVAAIIVAASVVLIAFNSFYKFKEGHLQICLGMFVDKLEYSSILEIKQNSETDEIYISYKTEKENESNPTFKMFLFPSNIEKVVESLRKNCPEVIIEIVAPEKKKKKK